MKTIAIIPSLALLLLLLLLTPAAHAGPSLAYQAESLADCPHAACERLEYDPTTGRVSLGDGAIEATVHDGRFTARRRASCHHPGCLELVAASGTIDPDGSSIRALLRFRWQPEDAPAARDLRLRVVFTRTPP